MKRRSLERSHVSPVGTDGDRHSRPVLTPYVLEQDRAALGRASPSNGRRHLRPLGHGDPLELAPCRDDVGIAAAGLDGKKLDFAFENVAVAFEMREPGERDHARVSGEGEKPVVHGPVDHGMGENVDSGGERHLRRFELLGVHRDPELSFVSFLDERLENGRELSRARTRVARLDEAHPRFEELSDFLASPRRRRHLDQHGVLPGPEGDLAHGEIREERAGGGDVRYFRFRLQLQLPPRSAERGDGRHPRAEESLESPLDPLLDSISLLFMRNEAGEVVVVGAGEETSGVEKVHVGIDVPGNDPLAGGIDDDVLGARVETGCGAEIRDAAVRDRDVRVRERRSARPVEERSIQENDARENEPRQTILRGRSGFRCIVRS